MHTSSCLRYYHANLKRPITLRRPSPPLLHTLGSNQTYLSTTTERQLLFSCQLYYLLASSCKKRRSTYVKNCGESEFDLKATDNHVRHRAVPHKLLCELHGQQDHITTLSKGRNRRNKDGCWRGLPYRLMLLANQFTF